MATQMESALRCTTCEGEGGREIQYCPYDWCSDRTPGGCAHMKTSLEECPDCLGSGVRACTVCGDDASVVRADEPYCPTCDPEREGDDGPAHGCDLREQYEQAQAMKRWSGHPGW